MNLDQIRAIHGVMAEGDWCKAASGVLRASGIKQTVKDERTAKQILRKLLQSFLDADDYLAAATLQWGSDMFDVRPLFVQNVFKVITNHRLVGLCGASSSSKTYSAGGYMLLDWFRDPEFTSVKLAAVNEDHLKKNLYAHIVSLYRACLIPLTENPDDVGIRDTDLWLGLKSAGSDFGITGISFRQSQDSSGQFKGYKPRPYRRQKHPKWGNLTRLRVLGDESQNWPAGPFKDFNSLTASMDGNDIVKIVCAFNPEDLSQPMVQKAEPEHGWQVDDVESLYEWRSKEGWDILRLDAAKSENVVAKKVIYPGIQTYDGFLSYLRAGGDNSPAYWTFARGFPPLKSAVNTVVPLQWVNDSRGEAIFVDKVHTFASIDVAYMGEDSPYMTVGRWGNAIAYRRANGELVHFMDRLKPSEKKPRHVMQVDQVFPLTKTDNTVELAEEIMAKCKNMQIEPEWVVMDKTGIGFGTWSHLVKYWGDVLGINWAEKASPKKVLSEDVETAEDRYVLVVGEMWFTARRWIDPTVRGILINPIVQHEPLNTQLSSRRFRFVKGGKQQVEGKEEYKNRNRKSPDAADSFVMAPYLIRMRGRVLPGLVEQEDYSPKKTDEPTDYEINQEENDSLSGVTAGHHESLDD